MIISFRGIQSSSESNKFLSSGTACNSPSFDSAISKVLLVIGGLFHSLLCEPYMGEKADMVLELDHVFLYEYPRLCLGALVGYYE